MSLWFHYNLILSSSAIIERKLQQGDRVDHIPLTDMFHKAESLQESFDYKAIHCYSNYVPSPVLGQPDELKKLTFYRVRISAEHPSMVIMHNV